MAALILVSAPRGPVEPVGPRLALRLAPTYLCPQLLSLVERLHPSLCLTKNGREAFPESLLEWAGGGSQDEEKEGCEVGSILVGKPRGREQQA